jgi:hypothetical protein
MGSVCIDPNFLDSTIVEDEWSASCPGRFIPGKNPQQHSWFRHCATSWKVTGLIPEGSGTRHLLEGKELPAVT